MYITLYATRIIFTIVICEDSSNIMKFSITSTLSAGYELFFFEANKNAKNTVIYCLDLFKRYLDFYFYFEWIKKELELISMCFLFLLCIPLLGRPSLSVSCWPLSPGLKMWFVTERGRGKTWYDNCLKLPIDIFFWNFWWWGTPLEIRLCFSEKL